ncbi:MAG: sensor histidine kinase [Lewinella sp.]
MSTKTTPFKSQVIEWPSYKEAGGVILFYFFFAYIYHVVMWYNGMGLDRDGPWGWLSLDHFWWSAGMQYLFCLFGSFFIWLLGVWWLRHRKQRIKIVAVLLLVPLMTYVLRSGRYVIVDYLEMGRLREEGAIWDLYIPWMFLLFQFGCYFAYTNFRENQRKLVLEAELRQAALKSELAAIKAQLNPHFLYNVFNTINASLPPGNERTRDMVARLSNLFRYQLRATKEELVPLGAELAFVTNYLDLEKSRFGDRLAFEIVADQSLMFRQVPPMILQPLVENSVRHGLSPLIEGGKITVSIEPAEDQLLFTVADTGVGVEDKAKLFGKGVGLTNTQLRLQKGYDTDLEIHDNAPRGLIIQFTL